MVKIKVDMENREKLKRLHTATHIVNFSAREVLGMHVWQNGSNLKPEEGTLDITHFDNLSSEEIVKIEKLANEIVFSNKAVKIEEIDRTEAERKYGYTLYQGGAIPMKTLRVVSVEDNDIEACGGIHMEHTGGIGFIKVLETFKVSDGVVRLKFVVRDFAMDVLGAREKLVSDLKSLYSVEEKMMLKTSEKFFAEWKEQKKVIDALKKELKDSYISQILAGSDQEFVLKGDFDMGFLMEVFAAVKKDKKEFKLVGDKFIVASSSFTVSEFKKEIKKGEFSIYVL